MSDFRILYTRCRRQDFENKRRSFLDTGLGKKIYFEDPKDAQLTRHMSTEEVIVGIPVEDFVGPQITFIGVMPGIWETGAVVLMRGMFEVLAH
jgi:hypothetical protein